MNLCGKTLAGIVTLMQECVTMTELDLLPTFFIAENNCKTK